MTRRGFWMAPRELPRLLAGGKLTPNAYTLLNFLGQWGADLPDGAVVTNELLAHALKVNEKTVRRALQTLRRAGFIEFLDHPGRAVFEVRTTPALEALMGVRVKSTSGVRSGTGSDKPRTRRDDSSSDTHTPAMARTPASSAGKQARGISDTSRAGTRGPSETETEREKLLLEASLSPNGLVEAAPTTTQRAASSAHVCDFKYETGPCGNVYQDPADLFEHKRQVHLIAADEPPGPTPTWPKVDQGAEEDAR